MARLSTATRHKVVLLHQQGLSQAEISRQTGVSRCAVQALLKKHKETGNVEHRRRSGRPRKLTAADERHIMLTSLRNRKMSSSAISSELAENSGTLVHPSTVRRSLTADTKLELQREASPDLNAHEHQHQHSAHRTCTRAHSLETCFVLELLFRDCNPFVLLLAIPIAG
ncbi:UNVERIFIED_CONTAM: hypothetical protein FKN15_054190 [Acipenser sinensis]